MRDYKGWTGQERLASVKKKTKEAIAVGIIPPPTKCNRCGKTTGRIDYHNHDYSDPVKYLEMLCQGCHTRLYKMENKAQTEATANGTVTIEASSTPSAPTVTKRNATTYTASSNRDKMHSIRVDFTKALGIYWSENQNPDSGYKFELNLIQTK